MGIVLKGAIVSSDGKLKIDKYVAIKVYLKSTMQQLMTYGSQEDPFSEISIQQLLGNDTKEVLGHLECMEDEEKLYVVMDYLPWPELYERVANQGAVPEEEARCIFHSIIKGLQHLHGHGVAHRDLSLENVLYNNNNHAHGCSCSTLKIIDFGMAVAVDLPKQSSKDSSIPAVTVPNIHTGKENYLPPEVLRSDITQVNPFTGDIWSAGICLLNCLLGFPPLEHASSQDIRYEYLVTGRLHSLLVNWQCDHLVSETALDLVEMILKEDPKERPSLQKISQHSWMMQKKDEDDKKEKIIDGNKLQQEEQIFLG